MKVYLKPVTETLNVQTLDCFMQIAGSGEHGEVVQQNPAPKKKFVFF